MIARGLTLLALAASLHPPAPPVAFPTGGHWAAAVTNPWFPLVRGSVYAYVDVAGGETDTMVVTAESMTIAGAPVTVVWDRTFRRGRLIEDTRDYYAQDDAGDVWYLGEDTRELRAGRVTSAEGTWRAGRDGGTAGIVMWARPEIGDSYRQEYLAGHAEDMARVVALDAEARVPAGAFRGAVATEEWSPLEPGTRERKVYARGIGMVEQRTLRGGREHLVLVRVERR